MTYNVFSGTLNPTQSINQGDHHVGRWPTFLVSIFFLDVYRTSTHDVALVWI